MVIKPTKEQIQEQGIIYNTYITKRIKKIKRSLDKKLGKLCLHDAGKCIAFRRMEDLEAYIDTLKDREQPVINEPIDKNVLIIDLIKEDISSSNIIWTDQNIAAKINKDFYVTN